MFLWIAACTLAHHPVVPARPPAPAAPATTWAEVLARPGPITYVAVVSAIWEGPVAGQLDVRAPAAQEAGVRRTDIPIVLPVGVLRHPERGTWLVDTGIDRALARGEKGALRGPLRLFAGGIEPQMPLGDIVEAGPVAGVLLTHAHFDHVLGLPDVPPHVPVYVGSGELGGRTLTNAAMRPVVRRALRGRAPVQEWPRRPGDWTTPAGAIDILGDGSLWALPTPGHTEGHTAYLALTTDGPVLFVGDASHTRWGWDHDVAPGWFSDDRDQGADSFRQLRALVAANPTIRVEVGHEAAGQDAVSAVAIRAAKR